MSELASLSSLSEYKQLGLPLHLSVGTTEACCRCVTSDFTHLYLLLEFTGNILDLEFIITSKRSLGRVAGCLARLVDGSIYSHCLIFTGNFPALWPICNHE